MLQIYLELSIKYCELGSKNENSFNLFTFTYKSVVEEGVFKLAVNSYIKLLIYVWVSDKFNTAPVLKDQTA